MVSFQKKRVPWRSGVGLGRRVMEIQTQESFKVSPEKVLILISIDINNESRNSIFMCILHISFKIKIVTEKK